MSGMIPFPWPTDIQKVKFSKYQMDYIGVGHQKKYKKKKKQRKKSSTKYFTGARKLTISLINAYIRNEQIYSSFSEAM